MTLALALLCAACAPAAPGARLSPSARSAAASSTDIATAIAAAESATYANHYATAASDYTSLITKEPRSAEAHVAYALFLEYRGDGTGAQTEATRAVGLDGKSADAQAVLCRVHDWAGDLSAAVAAGNTAVSVDAAQPLAHLFLSEALADSGDITGSQAQIDAATPLIAAHPTAYLQSELQRETANLAGDSGRNQDQIAAMQEAARLQPGWLVRTEEVAAAQVSAAQYGAAVNTLEAAAANLPQDPDALEGLGSAAMFAGDGSLALAAWQKAAALAPSDRAALDMVGEVQVSVNHDVNAAVTAFQHALTVHPDDADAAAYLTGLARFVQGQPGLASAEINTALQPDQGSAPLRGVTPPDANAALSTAATTALATVNAVRAQAGLGPVQLDSRLSDSATSHSFYWLFNNVASTSQGLGIHQESSDLLGFSGVTFSARDVAFGYSQPWVAEDITHRTSADAAVHDWVDSVYHRFPILRPDLVSIGYGQAEVGQITMQDMEFGYAAPGSAPPVRYPAAGQTGVPVRFVDNELPDPVPTGKQRITGYPVTVTFAAGDSATLSSFTLSGPDGAAVDAYVLQPSQSTENSGSLIAAVPLHAATRYTAHFVGTLNGRAYDQTWSFTTAG